MKKFLKIFGLVMLVLAVIIIGILTILTRDKNNLDKQISRAKVQVENYKNYKPDNKEYFKVVRSEKNDLYYYAADGKRYIFPSLEVYRSWYNEFLTVNLKVADLKTLYQTPLGGSVTFRPGTLMQTPTDPHIYMVIKNGEIRPLANEDMLLKIYGDNWQKQVSNIENYYFTEYKVGPVINSIQDFPDIPKSITINLDKGLNNEK